MRFLSLYQSLPILTVVVFFVLMLGITAYFIYAYMKEQELTDVEKENLAEYERILMKAHKKARSVVEKASKKAQQLLGQTKDFDRDALSLLTRELQQETNNLILSYHNLLTSTTQGQNETLKNAAADMEKLTEQEIQTYTKALQQTLVVSQGKIDQEVAADLEKAKKEIETYKAAQIAKADEKIKDTIDKITFQVLGRSIPMEDHEKLIVESLNKAKEEGLFTL